MLLSWKITRKLLSRIQPQLCFAHFYGFLSTKKIRKYFFQLYSLLAVLNSLQLRSGSSCCQFAKFLIIFISILQLCNRFRLFLHFIKLLSNITLSTLEAFSHSCSESTYSTYSIISKNKYLFLRNNNHVPNISKLCTQL